MNDKKSLNPKKRVVGQADTLKEYFMKSLAMAGLAPVGTGIGGALASVALTDTDAEGSLFMPKSRLAKRYYDDFINKTKVMTPTGKELHEVPFDLTINKELREKGGMYSLAEAIKGDTYRLIDLYPEFKDYRVSYNDIKDLNDMGTHYPKDKVIVLNKNIPDERLNESISHEGQHAIQGFDKHLADYEIEIPRYDLDDYGYLNNYEETIARYAGSRHDFKFEDLDNTSDKYLNPFGMSTFNSKIPDKTYAVDINIGKKGDTSKPNLVQYGLERDFKSQDVYDNAYESALGNFFKQHQELFGL